MKNALTTPRLTSAVAVLICCSISGLGAHRQILRTAKNRTADEVLHSLLASPLGKTAPALRYRVELIDDIYPNAFSNFKGKIDITSGIFPVLDGDHGVWAAVIGHELGHIILHHPDCLPRFEAALRQAYRDSRARSQDQTPPRWPNVQLGQGISRLKLSRAEELQADFIGMMLMAEAGYQPGFAVLLDQRLRYGLGDTPGVVALFSHHPRLETREEHTKEFYDLAMAMFRTRWPDAARSPGGNLPPYGEIGHWTFAQADGGHKLVFRVPFQVHNAAGLTVRVAAFFLDGDLRVRSTMPAFRATDGSLVANRFLPGADSKSTEVTLNIPKPALATQDHKLLAVVFLMVGKRVLDGSKLKVELEGN
ncbi:MAG: M48 family metalloprotease [Terriglobia bacterium]